MTWCVFILPSQHVVNFNGYHHSGIHITLVKPSGPYVIDIFKIGQKCVYVHARVCVCVCVCRQASARG